MFIEEKQILEIIFILKINIYFLITIISIVKKFNIIFN